MSASITTFDFTNYFPYKFWVSSWSKDEQYPNGFRYKLLSVRSESDDLVELVILLEESTGEKQELSRLDVSHSAFEKVAKTFIDGLKDEYALQFDFLDASHIVTAQEFEQAAISAGWREINLN
jgi:hypothetical protein